MAERDPIDLIKDLLNRVDKITGLYSDHESFKNWQAETKCILEKVFGTKSIHYQSFLALRFREVSVKAFASPEIDKINAQRYKKDLDNAKNVLQGALKELTLDRTLFKKIQTTPDTVDISLKGECFISSEISDPQLVRAIESALEESGLQPIHPREPDRSGNLFQKRIEQIRRARLGIYPVISFQGGEGLIEIGMALGLGKEVILLVKKGTPVPELLLALNPIQYEELPELMEKLKNRIA